MADVLQFTPPTIREMFSCAFEVSPDGTEVYGIAFATENPHPNRRMCEAFDRNAIKHVGNFYHQFKQPDRQGYVIAGVVTVDGMNRMSFEGLQDITKYVGQTN